MKKILNDIHTDLLTFLIYLFGPAPTPVLATFRVEKTGCLD